MKKTIVTLLLCLTLLSGARSQCTTLVEMVLGVENCLYPYIISTQQYLLPCSAPAGFYQLVPGDYALIDFVPSFCVSICMFGMAADITCFAPYYVGIDETKTENIIRLYPNPAVDNITIESPQNASIEMLNLQGQIVKMFNSIECKTNVDVSDLPCGVYFIRLNDENGRIARKFVKE